MLNYLETNLVAKNRLTINNVNLLSIRLTTFLEVRLAEMGTTTKRGFINYLKYFRILKRWATLGPNLFSDWSQKNGTES